MAPVNRETFNTGLWINSSTCATINHVGVYWEVKTPSRACSIPTNRMMQTRTMMRLTRAGARTIQGVEHVNLITCSHKKTRGIKNEQNTKLIFFNLDTKKTC